MNWAKWTLDGSVREREWSGFEIYKKRPRLKEEVVEKLFHKNLVLLAPVALIYQLCYRNFSRVDTIGVASDEGGSSCEGVFD